MALLQSSKILPPPKESNFNYSSKHRTNLFIGMATPVDCIDMIPGDVVDTKAHAKILTDALATPCLGSMRLQIDTFFVPYRILWDHWVDFIRQGEESDYILPSFGVFMTSADYVDYDFTPGSIMSDRVRTGALLLSPAKVSPESVTGYEQYYVFDGAYEDIEQEYAKFFNWPWINGYQEQEFSSMIWQNYSYEDAAVNDEQVKIGQCPVFNRTPFNTIRSCSLANYLRFPVGHVDFLTNNRVYKNSLLPFFAYNKIWYEWYRNPQELSYAFFGQPEVIGISTGDIGVSTTTVLNRVYTNKDMEDAIDIINLPTYTNEKFNDDNASEQYDRARRFIFSLKKRCFKHDYLSSVLNAENYDEATAVVVVNNNQFTINQWRSANHVDKFKKKSYLGGDRYIDWIRAQFGVVDSDARLQRPQLLSSSSSDIIFIDVESQAATDNASLGQLASRGISLNNQIEPVRFRATEHGVLMTIASIVPFVDSVFGIEKFARKTDTFDYFVPALDNIDMQPVHAYEYSSTDGIMQAISDDRLLAIASSGTMKSSSLINENIDNSSVEDRFSNDWESYFLNKSMYLNMGNDMKSFGYLPAWTEYKTRMNRVSGDLSSNRLNWVLSRPNPYENDITVIDVKNLEVYAYDRDGVYTIFNKDKMSKPDILIERSNGFYWINQSDTSNLIVPTYTDNYLNNVYVSQYVDFRDFAYLWPDISARYPTNVVQFAFDTVLRRPMSRWSLPL